VNRIYQTKQQETRREEINSSKKPLGTSDGGAAEGRQGGFESLGRTVARFYRGVCPAWGGGETLTLNCTHRPRPCVMGTGPCEKQARSPANQVWASIGLAYRTGPIAKMPCSVHS